MSMSHEEKIKKLLRDILDVKEEDLTLTAQFRADLGATSIDFVEFVAAIENEFDVTISDSDAEKLKTIGDAVAFLQAKTA
jgi:acyl carrier protein